MKFEHLMRKKGGTWFYELGIEWIMKSSLHIKVVSDVSQKTKESSIKFSNVFFSLESYAQMKRVQYDQT